MKKIFSIGQYLLFTQLGAEGTTFSVSSAAARLRKKKTAPANTDRTSSTSSPKRASAAQVSPSLPYMTTAAASTVLYSSPPQILLPVTFASNVLVP